VGVGSATRIGTRAFEEAHSISVKLRRESALILNVLHSKRLIA
jgi:hypothetical protein